MISCQRSSTSLILVKNRWPPRSKRYPSRTSLRARPPTWSEASSTTTGLPCLAMRYPAVSPAGPPPSTTTGVSGVMSGGFVIQHCAVGDAAGLNVIVGRHRDRLQHAGVHIGLEDCPPLSRSPAHELSPRLIPVLHAYGQSPHKNHL